MEEPRRSPRSPHSDENLARRVAQGDDRAFDELRHRYGRGLSRYAGRLVGDLALGESIAHRALRDAGRALRRGRRPACVSPWLYRLTLSTALQLRPGSTGETTPARLPERQRQAFVLREVYGLTVPEIAAELGLSAREVEEAQFAARRRLAGVAANGRAKRSEIAPPPSPRRLSARPAVLAVAAAAVALLIGMPVAATYAGERGEDPSRALEILALADRAL